MLSGSSAVVEQNILTHSPAWAWDGLVTEKHLHHRSVFTLGGFPKSVLKGTLRQKVIVRVGSSNNSKLDKENCAIL